MPPLIPLLISWFPSFTKFFKAVIPALLKYWYVIPLCYILYSGYGLIQDKATLQAEVTTLQAANDLQAKTYVTADKLIVERDEDFKELNEKYDNAIEKIKSLKGDYECADVDLPISIDGLLNGLKEDRNPN